MKILVVSNLYPPQAIGGYELGCRDVVDALARRGHQVQVLTSTWGIDGPRDEGRVWRWLRPDKLYLKRTVLNQLARPFRVVPLFAKERVNQAAYRRALDRFRPDLVYVWCPVGISLSIVPIAREAGVPLCWFAGDEWISRHPHEDLWIRLWQGGFLPGAANRLARPALLAAARAAGAEPVEAGAPFDFVHFCTRFLLDGAVRAGQRIGHAEVVHWGVDTKLFTPAPRAPERPTRLLYVGQVVPHKGVHTAVEALARVRARPGLGDVTLDVVGGSVNPAYRDEVAALARRLGVDEAVRFRGGVDRQALPAVYRDHHLLIFPSIWEEPFGLTLLEAMACGLPVVATATGGSAEFVHHGVNALTYPAGDADACAARVAALLEDPVLYARLRAGGREWVEARHTFDTMVDRLLPMLEACAAGAPHPAAEAVR